MHPAGRRAGFGEGSADGISDTGAMVCLSTNTGVTTAERSSSYLCGTIVPSRARRAAVRPGRSFCQCPLS
jgi:hypothetical protein